MFKRLSRTSLTLLAGCSAALLTTLAQAQPKPPHWAYGGHAGPTHWSELSADFGTCKLGQQQSPIDINPKAVKKGEQSRPISFAYTAGEAELVNNGHTIQVNLPATGAITVDGKSYSLLQFHFHTPSEEHFGGKAYPLVAHLVHKSDDGKLAVVAVLFKQGQENAALKPVFAAMPSKEGARIKLETPFDVSALLPANKAYYSFSGSLTTPPCSEEVKWHILRTPVTLSAAQLASFKKLYAMNARPVQPLNGRTVELSD